MTTVQTPSAPPVRGFARSLAMQDALSGLEAALAATGGVLVCGEPGSGRDLFARAIHLGRTSAGLSAEALVRRAMREAGGLRPFVSVDCGHRETLADRLFGPETMLDGAESLERIHVACALYAGFGGTVLFRQLSLMPARLQLRLARILRDGEVLVVDPAGGARVQPLAIRPIATAEDGCRELVPELERRMSQVVIAVPPLRARREDIPGLVRLLLADICAAAGIPARVASSQAVALLAALPWRGNVGELEALLRRLVRKAPGRQIRLAHVLAHVRLDGHPGSPVYTGTLREAREQFERDYVKAVLDEHRGRMAEAARALGLQRTNLYRKVRQLAVRRDSSGRQVS